jgi:hypothetical protein
MFAGTLRLTRYDKFLIGAIVLVIIAIFIYFRLVPAPQKAVIEIEVAGSVVRTADLTNVREQILEIAGKSGYSIVHVGENRVKMLDSACKDKICVHTGWIAKPGQQIICLPNQVVIKFKTRQAELDGVNG